MNLPTFVGGRKSYNKGWYYVGDKVFIKCDEGRTPRNKYKSYSVCQPDGTFKPKSLKCLKV